MAYTKAAVVIPIYRDELNVFEQISLIQVQKILGKYPIIFIAPEGKIFSYVPQNCKVIYFPSQYFQNVNTYSEMMKSAVFYENFLDYEYILIYQLDAFVFSDKLEYFCLLGYDYIGAPWFFGHLSKILYNGEIYRPLVGNGGFCLRKVKSCYDLLMKNANLVEEFEGLPEDVFFATCGLIKYIDFHVAPINIAYKFSTEFNPRRCVKKNGGELPFGCHAWQKFDADFYVNNFLQFGYDLRQIKNQMNTGELSVYLINFALQRLTRRINIGQSLCRYLSRDNFASIRVVRSPYTMLVLARLLLENNNLSDKIYFYDENELDILIQNLQIEKKPHLIVAGGERQISTHLLTEISKRGITYGSRVVDFHQEYLNCCTSWFNSLTHEK